MSDFNQSLFDQDVIPLKAASALLPGQPHLSTLIRWTTRGACGRKLETLKIGHKRYVTREALLRFVEQTPVQETPPRTARQRQRAVSSARKSLEKMGV